MSRDRTTLIGAGVSRPDAVDKVRGEARFTDDLAFPGMLHAWVVRSPHPYARIERIDASDALAMSGVVCVVTYEDVDGPIRMAAFRREIRAGDRPDPDEDPDVVAWIDRTFSLDYGRSFG